MRIALDAMGGDHAPGPIVAGAVQAVAGRPGIARRPRRRPGPDRAAAGVGVDTATASRSSTARRSSAWKKVPSWPCARSRTTPSAAAGNCWPSARSTASSVPATPAPWWPAACPQALPQERESARHRRRHADAAGALRAARRRRQRQPQAGASVSVRRHGQHLRQAHSHKPHAHHRPDERRLRGGEGHTTWPRKRTPCSTTAR